MFINGKRHHSVAFINKFDKKQMIGKIDNKNQIDIQAVDIDNNPLQWRKFHLELELK